LPKKLLALEKKLSQIRQATWSVLQFEAEAKPAGERISCEGGHHPSLAAGERQCAA
jgi:hypothetical protein